MGQDSFTKTSNKADHLCITTLDDTNLIFMSSGKLDNIAAGIEKFDWISVSGKFVSGTDTYVTIDIGKAKAKLNGGNDIKLYVSSLIADDIRISNIVESEKYEYSDFHWLNKIKNGDIDADAVGGEQIIQKSVSYSKLANDVISKLLVFNGRVVFPNTMILPAGKQIDIHYANVFRFVNPNKYNFVSMSDGVSYDGFRRYTYDDDHPDFTAAIMACIESERVSSIKRESRVNVKIAKTTDTVGDKKILFIGDSITSQGAYIGKLKEMIPEVTLLDTRQTTGNHNAAGEDLQYSGFPCEGRGGWAAYNYCNSTTQSGVSGNPFLNNGAFDFAFYMDNQGYSGVDFVFINLGTNDPVRGDKTIEQMLSCYNQMINSIHAYDQNIKVMLWLPPTRALAANSDHINISNSLAVNEALIAEFDNRQEENIILVPIYACVNPCRDYIKVTVPISPYNSDTITIVNDTIHPALSGHMKIADMMYGYIKYYSAH